MSEPNLMAISPGVVEIFYYNNKCPSTEYIKD